MRADDLIVEHDPLEVAVRDYRWRRIAAEYPHDACPPVPTDCWTHEQKRWQQTKYAILDEAREQAVKRVAARTGRPEVGTDSVYVDMLKAAPKRASHQALVDWYNAQ